MSLKAPGLCFELLASLCAFAGLFALGRNGSEGPGKKDISGGAVVQRERIDRFIEATSDMNIEDAIESLNENGETFGLITLASLSPSSLGRCYFKQIVGDRRVSKIFQHLLDQPSDAAASEATKFFDRKFGRLAEDWDGLAEGELGFEEALARIGPGHHAASVGLFFCSYFCSPQELDARIAKWTRVMSTPKLDSIQGIQYVNNTRYIDPLFHLNLLVISGHREGASVDELNRMLRVSSRDIIGEDSDVFPVTNLRLFYWDAETLDTDFTNLTRGVPASGNAVLLELPGFADPNSSLYLQDNSKYAYVESTIDTWRQNGRSK